jgi:hypothetical protein
VALAHAQRLTPVHLSQTGARRTNCGPDFGSEQRNGDVGQAKQNASCLSHTLPVFVIARGWAC